MFAIEVQTDFAAEHALRLGDGASEQVHGHDWHVVVRVESASLDALDTVMDFHALQGELEKVVAAWRNRRLNEIPPFDAAVNPSAERVAEQIGRALAPRITAPARLVEVCVTEAPGCVAIWRA